MLVRKHSRPDRRGVSILEAAVVYPVTMLLLIGTTVLGLGVFRFNELQALAREGARYASVHGPNYAAAQNSSYATSDAVLTYVESLSAGLQTNNLSCSVIWNPNPPTTATPSTVTVQLTYSWLPEAYFQYQPVTMTAVSTMPVTY